MDALNDIDETSDSAEENATTIDDNNSGRIELDEKIEHKPLPSTQSVLNQEKTVIRLVMKKPEQK